MHRKQMNSGFTLIELLVVIAIIAILAAILFPVFAQARGKARQTACLSQSKQIGTAVDMYTQDYEETLPLAYFFDAPPKKTPYQARGYHQVLQPYLKNVGVFLCPSDTLKRNPVVPYFPPTFPVSFAPNYALMPGDGYSAVALARLDTPADYIILSEAKDLSAGLGIWGYGGLSWPKGEEGRRMTDDEMLTSPLSPKTRLAYDRHNGGSNYIFADGHAKWLKFEQTFEPKWLWGPPNIKAWLSINPDSNSYK
jgi:prepilin-type N-terminal cleavage/methylation domain-containing protein/prepilin-type processing-associated H-X9-DG protein